MTGCEIGLIGYDHEIRDDTRPHHGPLPRGEGEHYHGAGNFLISIAITDSVSFTNQTHDNPVYHTAQNAANDSPSPWGAGVRASVNLIPLKTSRNPVSGRTGGDGLVLPEERGVYSASTFQLLSFGEASRPR